MTVTGLEGFVQNWCSGGKKASLLFSSWIKNKNKNKKLRISHKEKNPLFDPEEAAYVDAGSGRVELVFGQGRRRWGRQSGWGALIEEDAAVGKAVLPQVSEKAQKKKKRMNHALKI